MQNFISKFLVLKVIFILMISIKSLNDFDRQLCSAVSDIEYNHKTCTSYEKNHLRRFSVSRYPGAWRVSQRSLKCSLHICATIRNVGKIKSASKINRLCLRNFAAKIFILKILFPYKWRRILKAFKRSRLSTLMDIKGRTAESAQSGS